MFRHLRNGITKEMHMGKKDRSWRRKLRKCCKDLPSTKSQIVGKARGKYEWKRVQSLTFGKDPKPETSPIVKILRVKNEFFQSAAKWKKTGNDWVCFEATNPIQWMKGMLGMEAKRELIKLGCDWEWI